MAKIAKPSTKPYRHLTILEDISTLISHSRDLQQTLNSIVATVAERMETEVCSIYILDRQNKRLTLRATMGLDDESVDKVSMGTGEGLTGTGHRKNEAGDGRRCPKASTVQIFSGNS